MSIQFLCVSCRKPIEVDDQWAMKIVQCPYCQDQVTAPGISTYHPEAPAVAREVADSVHAPGAQDAFDAAYPAQAAYAPTAHRSNNVAIVALVLAILSLAAMVVVSMLLSAKLLPALSTEATPQEQQEAAQKLVMQAMENGESWVYTLSVVMLGGLACWGAGVICALIGISRPVRRGFGVAALVVAAIPLLLFVVQMAAG